MNRSAGQHSLASRPAWFRPPQLEDDILAQFTASGPKVAVIGAGFCGLAAVYELGRRGISAMLLESEGEVGGLAGSFATEGERLEKFHHHWFTSDVHIMGLIDELGQSDKVALRPSRTGLYYAHDFFKLSTPLDLLRFSPLPPASRIRLGLLALWMRRIRDWRRLEEVTAADWLRKLGGERAYQVVWAPLLQGKFGDLAEEVAAVWFWNKLKLRGSSRDGSGKEQLAYYQGGFSALADALVAAIRSQGGDIQLNRPATGLEMDGQRVVGVCTGEGTVAVDGVIATPALPIIADLMAASRKADEYAAGLRRIRYLANMCVVLELERSLSDIYWLNVNDPNFPFVGVIEHTNFEPASSYAGRHIVYLSRYCPDSDPFYRMPDEEAAAHALTHLRRMFPDLEDERVLASHVWRARYAQPVVVRGYRRLIPSAQTPLRNLFIASMAQVYPQDRGTNYAVKQGRETAQLMAKALGKG